MNSETPRQGHAYAITGVDTHRSAAALAELTAILQAIDPGRPPRTLLGPGHYASVLAIDNRTGIAVCTDGVGSKLIIAQEVGRFDTIGIDCVAMNVNDIICVGAEPLAMLDYMAVEQVDADQLRALAEGLRKGAERAAIEIPGGELAQLPELIRGHPSPLGFDLVGACFGTVPLDRVISGAAIEPGDAVIGLPSSGIHSNGLTLARQVLLAKAGYSLSEAPGPLGRPLADELLEPTEIYVQAILELLHRSLEVRGLAHISGDGLLNLLRLNSEVGYEISDPLAPQPIFGLIESAGQLAPADMYEVFNMGTGFCCILSETDADPALALLRKRYPSARRIGEVTAEHGRICLPAIGISGTTRGFAAP